MDTPRPLTHDLLLFNLGCCHESYCNNGEVMYRDVSLCLLLSGISFPRFVSW